MLSKLKDWRSREIFYIGIGEILPEEERKNFAKEHPGYRLRFQDRFPYFPLYISTVAVVVSSLTTLIPAIAGVIIYCCNP